MTKRSLAPHAGGMVKAKEMMHELDQAARLHGMEPPVIPLTVATTETIPEEERQASSLTREHTPEHSAEDAQSSKKARTDPDLQAPGKQPDLKPWDPTFYGLLHAHDYPEGNPDSDLLTEEELPPEATSFLRRLIRNCHRNLGHPSNFALVRLMVVAKCHPDMIAYAQHRKCDVCARRASPKRVPRASMPYRPTRFNDAFGIDLKWVKDATGETFYLLNILDLATGFNLGILLKDKSAKAVSEAFKNYWLTWAGPPGRVVADQGSGFSLNL